MNTMKNKIFQGVAFIALLVVARIIPLPAANKTQEKWSPKKVLAQFLPMRDEVGIKEREIQSIRAGILETGKDQFKISKAYLNEKLGDLGSVLSSAKLIPAIEVSSMKGFAIQSVEKDSVFAQLGLGSDDIIEEVNGIKLTTRDKGVEAFESLKTASKVTLKISRGSQLRTLSYEVK